MTAPPPAATARPVVLYVDQDAARRAAFERACGEHEVVTCAEAGAALAVLDLREVAVLVTVLRLPGLSGDELLRIARDVYPRMARIAIGRARDREQLARALEDGLVVRYLVAPWQADDVADVVRAACAGWTPAGDPAPRTRSLLHEIRSVLMSILANSEHLEALAEDGPTLRVALERATLEPPEAHRDLTKLLDELLPLARDLAGAARELRLLFEQLRH